jgi:hypothetical protein
MRALIEIDIVGRGNLCLEKGYFTVEYGEEKAEHAERNERKNQGLFSEEKLEGRSEEKMRDREKRRRHQFSQKIDSQR